MVKVTQRSKPAPASQNRAHTFPLLGKIYFVNASIIKPNFDKRDSLRREGSLKAEGCLSVSQAECAKFRMCNVQRDDPVSGSLKRAFSPPAYQSAFDCSEFSLVIKAIF
jgi:hypothetical protein